MDLVLCHTTADFDTLGAAVGLARLQPGARVVLTGAVIPRCSGLWRSIAMSIR